MVPVLRGAVVVGALALASLAGCTPTEIVVVADSDAIAGQDFVSVQFQTSRGNLAFADASTLPATWGLTPGDSAVDDFDVTVTLSRTPPASRDDMTPFATRKVSHVHFIDGETKVLFIPLFKRCGCVGTNCPNPIPVECREVISPALPDFDEDNIPHLPKSP
jgi:hypothetical protein